MTGIGRLRRRPCLDATWDASERGAINLRRRLYVRRVFDPPDAVRVGLVEIAWLVEIVVGDEILESGLVSFRDRRIRRNQRDVGNRAECIKKGAIAPEKVEIGNHR